MMAISDFERAVAELQQEGRSEEDAARLVAWAGDVIELDEQGRRVIRNEQGAEVARL